MTKKEERALRDELAAVRKRAREIVVLLRGPKADHEVLVYLRAQPGPVKGHVIADALGKTHPSTVKVLSEAVALGHAVRVGVGEYEAVTP